MKRTSLGAVLLAVLVAVISTTTGCTLSTNTKGAAVQSILNVERTTDLLMTILGNSYRAGVFGAVGSPQAEQVRSVAEKASRAVSAASSAALAAIESGQDPNAYIADITAAIAQLQALLPKSKQGAFELLRPVWTAERQLIGRRLIHAIAIGISGIFKQHADMTDAEIAAAMTEAHALAAKEGHPETYFDVPQVPPASGATS